VQQSTQPAQVRINHALLDEYLPKVGAIAMMVYVYLERHADTEDKCWPSHRTIAASLRIGRNVAMRSTRALEEHGLITIKKTKEPGSYLKCVYTLTRTIEKPVDIASRRIVVPRAFPDVFSISDEMLAWADEHEFSAETISNETEKFTRWYRARKSSRRDDWGQEWRLWMMRSFDRAGTAGR
jgi:GntR family transcriptional regulator